MKYIITEDVVMVTLFIVGAIIGWYLYSKRGGGSIAEDIIMKR